MICLYTLHMPQRHDLTVLLKQSRFSFLIHKHFYIGTVNDGQRILILGFGLILCNLCLFFFRHFLEMNIDLPEDKARDAVVDILKHLNCTFRELRRLFLVEDLVDSIKVTNLQE